MAPILKLRFPVHVWPLAPVLRGVCNILGAGEIFVPITQVFVISCFAPAPIATYQYWCFEDKAKIKPRMQIFHLLFECFWAVWKWLSYPDWRLVALCCVLAWGASLQVAGQSSGQSWYITTDWPLAARHCPASAASTNKLQTEAQFYLLRQSGA